MSHERRYASSAGRLRSAERVALLEVPRVIDLSREGLPDSAEASVLDVGTGTGIFAEAFRHRGVRVTGLDANPDLLAEARRLVPGVTFTNGTAEELAFPAGSFDLVFLGLVLHETDDPLRALSEARRVARQRVMVLEWPHPGDDRGPPLAHRLTASEIEALATRAGFVRVERIDLSYLALYRLTP